MNKVLLVGRLTTKPELRYTGSNLPYTRFSVAVNRTFTNASGERETDFINVVVWRKQAENVCNYLNKGSLVAVEGRIQTGSFTDKDGNTRYTTEVAAESVSFLESKSQGQTRSNDSGPSYSAPVNVDDNPFAEFGDSVSIDDNFLD